VEVNMLNFLNNTYWWVRHRTTDRYHTVRCDGLAPGYYEIEDRLLHSMFGLLREFVEHELPAQHRIRKQSRRPDRTSGIEHLDWEISLVNDHVDKDDPEFGKPTSQAIAAAEVKVLYLWWVDERPKRREPMDESGAFDAYKKLDQSGYQWCSPPTEEDPHRSEWAKDKDDLLYQDWSAKAQLSHEIEERQHAEDEEMMKRLVAVRRSMWT